MKLSPSQVDRFWSKIDKFGPTPSHRTELGSCWVWTRSRNKADQGYGQVGFNYRVFKAHRVAYELEVGPVPKGKELDHLCRNPVCVNPVHLEPVTHAVNMARGVFVKLEYCKRGHSLSDENVRVYAKRRHCIACGRIRGKKKENLVDIVESIEADERAMDKIAQALTRIAIIMEKRFEKEYPVKAKRDALITKIPSDEDRLRESLGDTGEPIDEWLDIGDRERKVINSKKKQ